MDNPIPNFLANLACAVGVQQLELRDARLRIKQDSLALDCQAVCLIKLSLLSVAITAVDS